MTGSPEAIRGPSVTLSFSEALSPDLEVCTILAVYSLPGEQAGAVTHADPMQHAVNNTGEKIRAMPENPARIFELREYLIFFFILIPVVNEEAEQNVVIVPRTCFS